MFRRVFHVLGLDEVVVLAIGPATVKQEPVMRVAVEPQSATDAAKDIPWPRWEAGAIRPGVHFTHRAATERPGDTVNCLPRLRSSLVPPGLSGHVESRVLSALLGSPGGHRGPGWSCCRWGRQAKSTPQNPILSRAATTIPATVLTSTSSLGHR
uniref:Putative secreted protein n=1 Tax=Ixodes ricinus TaxID=34613 RepID=A0A147BJ54_IXORI